MDNFEVIARRFHENPSIEMLNCLSSHLEMLTKIKAREAVKRIVMNLLIKIRSGEKYNHIRYDEAMLRLYKIAGKVSQKMGAIGIFEQLEKGGKYEKSLQFHLLWAEAYAVSKDVNGFGMVLNLARERLATEMSNLVIEAGFRDLADEFLQGNVNQIFLDADDTILLFDTTNMEKSKKVKRRSSICELRRFAPQQSTVIGKTGFGTKTTTLIRSEFIDINGHFGVSPEEYCYAAYKDDIGEVDMDISIARVKTRKDSGTGALSKPLNMDTINETKQQVENRMNENLRRRHLSIVDEEKSVTDILESDSEKRARLHSPLIATNDAQRIPLRPAVGINQQIPTTITLSSDTKISTLDEVSFDLKNDKKDDGIDEERLRAMSAGRKDHRESSNAISTSSVRTAKSSETELNLISEDKCLEARAMFSETVHLGSDRSMNIEEFAHEKALKSTQNLTSDFSVLCDPDPTFYAPNIRNQGNGRSASLGLNVIYDEETQDKLEEKEAKMEVKNSEPQQKPNILHPKSMLTPPSGVTDVNLFDESIVIDLTKSSSRNIVTSTPAVGIPFVGVEEYFGNSEIKNERFAVPSGPSSTALHSKLTRRKSLAPNLDAVAESKKTENSVRDSSKKCDESLSEQLGRRLSLGGEEITAQIKNSDEKEEANRCEETGIKNRRRSEIIRGDVNPWDENLRNRLMKMVRPSTNMHELNTSCPKIQAMKTFEIGGERYSIGKLLGQGGYAKVYKAHNEEEKTVAVKVEVPSCAWEVYICDQLRNRLIKKGGVDVLQISDQCIMQVIDAYIFTNCSLLVNEYHEYGTLLDYANNNKCPNWHISCFLITQMAKIIREVHEVGIIHSDIKPDNFMIIRKIDMKWQKEELMSSDSYVIKLIDWGRSIDMISLRGRTFSGAAGTEGFDCPEMRDGRPWSFQADYFGFAATIAVILTGKYCDLQGSKVGEYSLNVDIKRRNILRPAVMEIMKNYLNITSSLELPDWNIAIDSLVDIWNSEFDSTAWRQSAIKFNECCDKART